jgi:hypothetical protein
MGTAGRLRLEDGYPGFIGTFFPEISFCQHPISISTTEGKNPELCVRLPEFSPSIVPPNFVPPNFVPPNFVPPNFANSAIYSDSGNPDENASIFFGEFRCSRKGPGLASG